MVFIKDLSEAQNDVEKELKGPAINVAFDAENKPTKALEGFLKSQNLSLEQIEKKDFKGNIFVFAKTIQKGIKSIELLSNFIQYLISSISVTRGMRWADYNLKFSRPIQWILALFGNEIMNFELESIKSSNFTMGHRFLSSGKIEINSADEYFSKLLENKVLLDNEKRKANIVEQLNKIAESVNASVIVNESLLNEVNQLVEYPFAIMGSFDERYL